MELENGGVDGKKERERPEKSNCGIEKKKKRVKVKAARGCSAARMRKGHVLQTIVGGSFIWAKVSPCHLGGQWTSKLRFRPLQAIYICVCTTRGLHKRRRGVNASLTLAVTEKK